MILIRPYTINDYSSLSIVIDQVCGDTPWMSTRKFVPTYSWVHAMNMHECPAHHLFVAEFAGEIVGWCRSFPPSCTKKSSHAELGIGLLKKWRGLGIGSNLIANSLNWAKSTGLHVMELTVSSQNYAAVHVFEKHGFRTTGTHENQLLMSICLS